MKIGKRFYYRDSDRKVAVTLLLFAAVCVGLIVYIGGDSETENLESPRDSLAAASYARSKGKSEYRHNDSSYYSSYQSPPTKLFPFDPNTADSTALLSLGLRPWQVRNIYKYRASGGIYRKPSDFARLYGLTKKQYEVLEPYIRISDDYQPAANFVKEDDGHARRDTTLYPLKLKPNEHITLNAADTNALKRVPGIGSYYARAIVRYGDQLGGYVSIGQLDEIEGFPTESKHFFKLGSPQPKRMNINKLSLNELRRHPYIGYYRARTIIEYRRTHGHINSLDDLRLDRDFTPEAIERLRPYVEY